MTYRRTPICDDAYCKFDEIAEQFTVHAGSLTNRETVARDHETIKVIKVECKKPRNKYEARFLFCRLKIKYRQRTNNIIM